MSLMLMPLGRDSANDLVKRWHRHHGPVAGYKFAIGVRDEAGELHGAAIVGRPVARALDDGYTAEVTRLVTDGTPNACSMLYAACWRADRGMGYRRIDTYILASEPGTSLRAAGWRLVGAVRGHSWNTPSRPRVDRHPIEDKTRWEISA